MSGASDRLGRQKPVSSVLSSAVTFRQEIIRHTADVPRVLHCWASPGCWAVERPFIAGVLHQECNGIERVERVEIPWHGRAFNVLPGEVWLEVLVSNPPAAPPLPADATVFATIAPGLANVGEAMLLRLDTATPSLVVDAEDPALGCLFATSLLVAPAGIPGPATVTYNGGLVVVYPEAPFTIDWRPKATVAIVPGNVAVNLTWRYFR